LIVLIVGIGIGITLSSDPDAILRAGANEPTVVREQGQVYRLFTAMFMHAGLLHVLLNANLLYILGWPLEKTIGHWRFLTIYLAGGLIGGLVHVFLSKPDAGGLGASTALYAVLGANWIMLHRRRAVLGRWERAYLYGIVTLGMAGLIVGIALDRGALSIPIQAGNWGHFGGLLAGFVMGWFVFPGGTLTFVTD
jgi:rhomboid protease GluP